MMISNPYFAEGANDKQCMEAALQAENAETRFFATAPQICPRPLLTVSMPFRTPRRAPKTRTFRVERHGVDGSSLEVWETPYSERGGKRRQLRSL